MRAPPKGIEGAAVTKVAVTKGIKVAAVNKVAVTKGIRVAAVTKVAVTKGIKGAAVTKVAVISVVVLHRRVDPTPEEDLFRTKESVLLRLAAINLKMGFVLLR